MLCSQMKSQFFFFICTFGIDFFRSDFLWAKCCKWKYLHPVVSLQLSSWFSLFVTPNTGRHWQLLHCVWQRSPVEKATSHWPHSGNNVCLWIPGKKKKKGSRGQTAERVDDMPALPVFILESNWDAACWALQLRFEQPSHSCAHVTSSCVRKPTVPFCCWVFVSFVVVVYEMNNNNSNH